MMRRNPFFNQLLQGCLPAFRQNIDGKIRKAAVSFAAQNRNCSYAVIKRSYSLPLSGRGRLLLGTCRPSQQFVTLAAPALFSSSPFNLSPKRRFSSPSDPRPPRRQGMWGMIASVGAVAAVKIKYVIAALKFMKFGSLLSMIASSVAYSMIFGWSYGIGMVGTLLLHESGHVLVMRRYGYPVTSMWFIPFMGAVVSMKGPPRNAFEDAMIAFGGPVLGGVGAAATMSAAVALDSQLLFALADFGGMINLMNMLPIGSMDGGRIGNAISPYFGLAGLGVGGYLIYTGAVHNPLFYLIMLGGAWSTGSRLLGNDEQVYGENFYRIGGAKQAGLLIGYVGVVGSLIFLMAENNKHKKSAKQIKYEIEHPESASLQPWEAKEDDYFEKFFEEEEVMKNRPPSDLSGGEDFFGSDKKPRD